MEPIRKHGKPPYSIAVIHGGPGAWGDMEPVANELAKYAGILEPMQRARNIDDLIEELKTDLEENAMTPVVLIGHSWGALLSLLFASAHPRLVKKVVLIGCPLLTQESVPEIMNTRLSRIKPDDRKRFLDGLQTMDDPAGMKKLLELTDNFDPIPETKNTDLFIQDIYQTIWNEAVSLRNSGKLLNRIKKVGCPVTAIHGGYDPHPAKGVMILSDLLQSFRFILLEKCGHYPWKENQAKEKFYEMLKKELTA